MSASLFLFLLLPLTLSFLPPPTSHSFSRTNLFPKDQDTSFPDTYTLTNVTKPTGIQFSTSLSFISAYITGINPTSKYLNNVALNHTLIKIDNVRGQANERSESGKRSDPRSEATTTRTARAERANDDNELHGSDEDVERNYADEVQQSTILT